MTFGRNKLAGMLLATQLGGGNVKGRRGHGGASSTDGLQLQFLHSPVLGQLAAGFEYVSPLKASGRQHCVVSKKRDATGAILQVCQAASRAYIMRLVSDHAGYHYCFAEMRGTMIATIADRVPDRQGLGSLRRCLDRSQTDVEERPQASKTPVHDPQRSKLMLSGHFSPIVAESRVPLAFGAWR